jgi:murein DD-endopeptidase MepM/ murein hydrolase activator NlpD
LIWPVDGPVVSGFGMRWGRMHEGIDIAVPAGTPIRAADAGAVVLVQSDAESGGYGNFTCLDHGGGLQTCYAHQSSFAVTSGSVSQGDVIGYVGCTATATATTSTSRCESAAPRPIRSGTCRRSGTALPKSAQKFN